MKTLPITVWQVTTMDSIDRDDKMCKVSTPLKWYRTYKHMRLFLAQMLSLYSLHSAASVLPPAAMVIEAHAAPHDHQCTRLMIKSFWAATFDCMQQCGLETASVMTSL